MVEWHRQFGSHRSISNDRQSVRSLSIPSLSTRHLCPRQRLPLLGEPLSCNRCGGHPFYSCCPVDPNPHFSTRAATVLGPRRISAKMARRLALPMQASTLPATPLSMSASNLSAETASRIQFDCRPPELYTPRRVEKSQHKKSDR